MELTKDAFNGVIGVSFGVLAVFVAVLVGMGGINSEGETAWMHRGPRPAHVAELSPRVYLDKGLASANAICQGTWNVHAEPVAEVQTGIKDGTLIVCDRPQRWNAGYHKRIPNWGEGMAVYLSSMGGIIASGFGVLALAVLSLMVVGVIKRQDVRRGVRITNS